jgi:hypothetical protein
VPLQFPNFLSHRSSGFLRVIRLMILATQLTALLHTGSRVTCPSFLKLCLRFGRLSRQGRVSLRIEGVIFLVGNPYAEAVEAVSRGPLNRFLPPELISILGEINSEARL